MQDQTSDEVRDAGIVRPLASPVKLGAGGGGEAIPNDTAVRGEPPVRAEGVLDFTALDL
jgi:hypothetical protein